AVVGASVQASILGVIEEVVAGIPEVDGRAGGVGREELKGKVGPLACLLPPAVARDRSRAARHRAAGSGGRAQRGVQIEHVEAARAAYEKLLVGVLPVEFLDRRDASGRLLVERGLPATRTGAG